MAPNIPLESVFDVFPETILYLLETIFNYVILKIWIISVEYPEASYRIFDWNKMKLQN
jgi:hypothetical protein